MIAIVESSGSNRFVVLLEAEGWKECGRGFLDEVGSNIWQYWDVILASGVAYMCCDGLRMIKWSNVDLQGSGCGGGYGCLSSQSCL